MFNAGLDFHKYLWPNDMSITLADGSPLYCKGRINLEISVYSESKINKSVKEMCYFTPSVKHPLISVKCLKKLKVIPQEFRTLKCWQ